MRSIQTAFDERLIKQAKRLHVLTQQLRQSLPPQCDGHYHVANIRRDTLVIITDSPVWTTRLRQLAPDIVKLVQQAGARGIRHVNVVSRVNYQPPKRPPVPRIRRSLSQASRDIIDSSAESISDEGLKRALKKLARHQG